MSADERYQRVREQVIELNKLIAERKFKEASEAANKAGLKEISFVEVITQKLYPFMISKENSDENKARYWKQYVKDKLIVDLSDDDLNVIIGLYNKSSEQFNNQQDTPPNDASNDQPQVHLSEFGSKSADAQVINEQTVDKDFWAVLKGLKKKFEPLYYYVWWVFENPEDFHDVRKRHKYPHVRGTSTYGYTEIPSKDIAEALSGTKSESDVKGYFLGAMGLRGRNEIWTNEVPIAEPIQDMLKSILVAGDQREGPIIGLGVARAHRWSWRMKEMRGLTDKGLMKFDVQKLEWKWTTWLGGKGKDAENDGRVKVRTVTRESFDANKSNLADLIDPSKTTGIENATITYKASSPSKKTATEISDPDGFAVFRSLPLNNPLTFTATKKSGYQNGKQELPQGSITLTDNKQQYVIIPMDVEEGPKGDPSLLIKPRVRSKTHKTPLQQEFDSNKTHSVPVGSEENGHAQGQELSFDLGLADTKQRTFTKDEKVWIEVFLVHLHSGKHVVVYDDKLMSGDRVKWQTSPGDVVIEVSSRRKKGCGSGKINQSIELQFANEKTGKVITPSFDIPKGIVGEYAIYCLAKKTDKLFCVDDSLKSHLDHVKADSYHSIPKDNQLLWDYNYITFTVGPEVVGRKGSASAPGAKELKEITAIATLPGKPTRAGFSNEVSRNTAKEQSDYLVKNQARIQQVLDQVQDNTQIMGILHEILNYIIAQSLHSKTHKEYSKDLIKTLKDKQAKLNEDPITYLENYSKALYQAAHNMKLIEFIQKHPKRHTKIQDVINDIYNYNQLVDRIKYLHSLVIGK